MWVTFVKSLIEIIVLIIVFQFFFVRKQELQRLQERIEEMDETISQLKLKLTDVLGPLHD